MKPMNLRDARDSAFEIEVIEVDDIDAVANAEMTSATECNRDVAERLLAAVRERATAAQSAAQGEAGTPSHSAGAAQSEAGTTSHSAGAAQSEAGRALMPERGMARLDFLETRIVEAVLKGALREHGVASLGELGIRDPDAADVVVTKIQRVRALARHLRLQALNEACARMAKKQKQKQTQTQRATHATVSHGSLSASI